ncbi:MAG: ATP-binding cassette domain-containing protein [Lachnospiraceae bacterium]|nr:ATP-binding cassette domain-containing protein [Lachnospiraceae bacterium]
MSFIQIEHLSKTYKGKDDSVHALNDINLNIEKGEIYGIIGLSGAGKSTLVRCINLLERPCEGKILIDGKNMPELSEKELREERRKIAMIFQQFNLLMQRNVLDNVCFPLEIAGVKRKEARLKAREFLKTVEIAEKAKAYPVQLSGGQKQRVAIARALASNPEIILCDEATSALDPQTTGRILKLLKQINEDYGITVVIITHEMRVIEEICNRVAVLDKGNLVEEGPVSEVFKNPRSKAAKRLLLTKELSEEGEENGLN